MYCFEFIKTLQQQMFNSSFYAQNKQILMVPSLTMIIKKFKILVKNTAISLNNDFFDLTSYKNNLLIFQ
ncbi:unnamed protein product [Paramecium octaurelia]|uniref:Uncharacterized protein n=1 Tax=Paramecium octaurelia TaxID=43137 RepID=A0A8S1YSX6_PAROT|nr:unnamed protein product [Paramecium octaurelia]CAD8215444.1 unnamed protein product [Paramecium octaurelia]